MSSKVVVVGTVSAYTTVAVESFPVRYVPTCPPHWTHIGVSGVAAHVARVHLRFGNEVRLCTVVGRDPAGTLIRAELDRARLLSKAVVETRTSSSGVVLVDREGRRMGLPYLAPVDEFRYPFEIVRDLACGADVLVLTNARFVRPLVTPAAALGVPIAVDVHLIADLKDAYAQPWLEHAQIVFCSHERLAEPRSWVGGLFAEYRNCEIVGVGMGAQGALLGLRDGTLIHVAAAPPRRIVNTSGAGDALFATFLAVWLRTGDPVEALRSGVAHAGWKIGHRRPAAVALTADRLAELCAAAPPAVLGRWDH